MTRNHPVQLPPIGAAAGDSILGELAGGGPAAAGSPAAPSSQRPAGALRAARLPEEASGRDPAARMVAEALDAAKTRPRELEGYSVRLPPGIRDRLSERVAADTEVTLKSGESRGRLPGLGHYIDAALAAIPADPGEAEAWARQWLVTAGADAFTEPVPSGSKVRSTTRSAMVVLARRLRTVKAWQVHAAAVSRLLDELDGQEAARRKNYRRS